MNWDWLILQTIHIVVGTIIVAPFLWFAGRLLVGREKAKFTDALWIMFLGQVIGGLANYGLGFMVQGLFSTLVAFIVQLIIWLGLIKHFFDTGWGTALVIAIIAVIISAIVFAIIAAVILGLGILTAIVF